MGIYKSVWKTWKKHPGVATMAQKIEVKKSVQKKQKKMKTHSLGRMVVKETVRVFEEKKDKRSSLEKKAQKKMEKNRSLLRFQRGY